MSDVGPLAALTGLQWLNLSGTPVSDDHVRKLREALPKCQIHRRDSEGGVAARRKPPA
ncbi:MAG: hypothetical protein NTY19_13980 [Planctomycetota bacterium]|nr:hypothetical protein [Planctomycetota bacterium]